MQFKFRISYERLLIVTEKQKMIYNAFYNTLMVVTDRDAYTIQRTLFFQQFLSQPALPGLSSGSLGQDNQI